jgi:FHA domain
MNLWSDEQILVHIEGPDGERDVVVPGPLARIGAHPDSQIVLQGPGIAQRALYLHATPNGIYALNLDLEDTPLDRRGQWITDDRPLLVGMYRLTVRAASGIVAAPTLPDLVASNSAQPPIPVVAIYCGKLLKDRRRFRSPLSLLGRRPQCSLQLRGIKVSSFHCALYWQDRRLWCVDLLSSNGTTISGQPVHCAELQLNHRLELGEFGLVYYRWSPRSSMSPGWQPVPLASAVPTSKPEGDAVAPPAAAPLAWDNERQELQMRIAELQAQLLRAAHERDALETTHHQWIADRDQWQAQREALEAAHRNWLQLQTDLGQQRDALEEARRAWQQERNELTRERDLLAEARQTWQQERDALATQLAEHEQQIAHLEVELRSASPPPSPVPDNAASETALVRRETHVEVDLALCKPQSDANNLASDQCQLGADDESTRSVAEQFVTATQRQAAARRAPTDRDELRSLVSDRLIDIKGAKPPRAAVLWGAVGIIALSLAALAFGVRAWLF